MNDLLQERVKVRRSYPARCRVLWADLCSSRYRHLPNCLGVKLTRCCSSRFFTSPASPSVWGLLTSFVILFLSVGLLPTTASALDSSDLLIAQNSLIEPRRVPGVQQIKPERQAIRSFDPQLRGFRPVVFPVVGPRVSSKYGMRIHPIKKFSRMHSGIDLAAPKHSAVRVVADGVVVFADPYAGYGNLVVVHHGRGITTHYGHCESISAVTGTKIKAGQIIATVGSTGHSTGPHLHFEIRLDGKPTNPEKFLEGFAAPAAG